MGKKNKDKKRDVKAKKADPKVTSEVQPNQSGDTSTNSSANCSQDLICSYCEIRYDENRWFVQCDNCDQYAHFLCAGIIEIRTEDPWICRHCKLLPEFGVTPQKNGPNVESNKYTVTVDVHEPQNASLENSPAGSGTNQRHEHTNTPFITDLEEGSQHSQHSQSSVVLTQVSRQTEESRTTQDDRQHDSSTVSNQNFIRTHQSSTLRTVQEGDAEPNNQLRPLSTQVSSNRARSVSSKSGTVSSTSTSRRRDIELQRVKEEFEFQTKIDAEALQLKLEALKLKEARQKKFLEGKYKALSEKGGDSVVSRRTDVTQKSSLVTSWIESQRNQIRSTKAKSLDENQQRSIQRFDDKIDEIGFEVSIPVEGYELNKIRAANHTEPPLVTKHRTYIDEQIEKFVEWRNNAQQSEISVNNGVESNINAQQAQRSREPYNRLDARSQQENQPPVSSFSTSFRSKPANQMQTSQGQFHQRSHDQFYRADPTNEFAWPKYNQIKIGGNQMHDEHQQRNVPVQQTSSQFETNPRSRSTLLNEQSNSVKRHNQYTFDVQDPSSTYVFSRPNQPTSSHVTGSGYENQRNGPACTVNGQESLRQPKYSTMTNNAYGNHSDQPQSSYESIPNRQPIISSMENPSHENQYYDQIYSFHNPVSSSMQQNVEYDSHHRHPASSNQPILSTMVSSNTNTNLMQGSRLPLTSSQIAARHAISKDLPQFAGNPREWCRFIKRYINSTNMCGYTEDENLERLDKCLKEPARRLVESLLLMPNSVAEVIDTLQEKYGRPEQVIKLVLEDVRKFTTIKPERLELLSDFGYAVRNACNQIEDLNMRNYLVNPELMQEIVDKLPYQTKIDWARYSENLPGVTLRILADWLHRLAKTINRITPSEASTSTNEQKGFNTNKNEKDPEKSKSGYVYVHDNIKSSRNSELQSKCSICGKNCKSVETCSMFKGLDVDQRWKTLINHKLCRKCLKFHKRNCHVSIACGVNGCEYKHHSLLHNESRYSKEISNSANPDVTGKVANSSEQDNTNSKVITTGSNHSHHLNHAELFRIVPVKLYANGHAESTYAYLDEGSSFTLMERKMADKLGLSGTPETICLLWTNNIHRREETEKVNFEIAGIMCGDDRQPSIKYTMKAVNVVEELNLPEQSLAVDKFKQRYDHLRGIPIAGYENITPTLLIGIKHARLSVPLETIEGKEDDPIATRSRLGWSIYGPDSNKSIGYINTHRVATCPCQDRDDEIHKIIKDHFTIENFGVIASPASLDSKENEKALKMLQNLTIRKGHRFETGLLWKNNICRLPDNYGMARKRLECSENKGQKVIDVINEAVKEYVKKGYVHQLSRDELAEVHSRVWYLPLFTVVNPKKPEKLRTVFDAAAKVKGVSLNSMLYNGPDLVPSIVDILRRFRENKIAITGDIKEMYHQVMMKNEDKHSQRFLWRNGEKDRDPDTYVVDVLTFGSRSFPCSAQFVKNLNASEFEKDYPRAAISIKKNTYVDDLMDGERSVQETIQLIQDTKFVYLQGGFEIRNFKSNSKEVLAAIGEPVENGKVMVDDGANIERVLGMFWDTKSDSFTFSLKYTKVTAEVLAGERLPTKRELLKLLMSIFDPLGLLSYYLVHLKILLQRVWRSKINWDEKLPDDLKSKWERWIKILPNVEKLRVPRWYFQEMAETTGDIEMHIFTDAGDYAFAATAYLRFETSSGYVCALVGSKTRVAPLKYLSITRKELMAALLGTRLSNSIREGLSSTIRRRVLWSDSSTVLTWLQSEHQKYSQFVGHRVGEILETSELSEWRYVPSKLNVADEATKWTRTPTFAHTDRWFTGPEFLQNPESEWPRLPKSIVPNGTTEEMRLSCSHSGLILPEIVNPRNFSKWERAVRAVAFAIRWGKKLLAKVRKVIIPREPLTQDELQHSEKLLFRQAQWQGFTEEMLVLTKNQKYPGKHGQISNTSPIYDCSPYLDDFGLMRVEGRIDKANALNFDARRPIILPKDNALSRLLMLKYHRQYLHRNHETVVNELRQRFYIPRLRVAFRSARWNCKLCEVKRSRPRAPKMADLPAIRFEYRVRVFTYTGIDYFGPMEVMVGRRHEKRWGVLFTCLTVRAIHIEISNSLDTASCIKVIRNFINTRGTPAEFYSDNGTNFVGANNELTKELERLNEHELSTSVTSCYTKWIFNPPASPHMGGCWERLIGTVKACMEESMPTRTPKDEDLRSLLMEIMNIVNARPLTYIPLESCNAEALTPNHFIFGSSNGIKPPGKFTNDGPYLRQTWKEIQRCTDIFWERFIKEYVPMLTRRSKWFENVKPVEIGDIVLVIDHTNPRNTYPRAKVIETRIGSKDQVRSARVQFANGNALWRPTAKLAVLDVLETNDKKAPTDETTIAPTKEDSLDHLSTIETGGNNVGATFSNLRPKTVRNEKITDPEVSARITGASTELSKGTEAIIKSNL